MPSSDSATPWSAAPVHWSSGQSTKRGRAGRRWGTGVRPQISTANVRQVPADGHLTALEVHPVGLLMSLHRPLRSGPPINLLRILRPGSLARWHRHGGPVRSAHRRERRQGRHLSRFSVDGRLHFNDRVGWLLLWTAGLGRAVPLWAVPKPHPVSDGSGTPGSSSCTAAANPPAGGATASMRCPETG